MKDLIIDKTAKTLEVRCAAGKNSFYRMLNHK